MEPTSAIQLGILLVALVAAATMARKKPKTSPREDVLLSVATRGAYIPLGIGRFRTGLVTAWVESLDNNLSLAGQGNDTPGMGKGTGGRGTSNHYERALHLLCVGPASALHAIYQNGETIWEGPITPDTHPSGTTLTALNGEGTFTVFWGTPADPDLPYLASSETHGLTVKYAYVMKIMWDQKNLGNARTWPRLEYEVSCPCYSQIAETAAELPLQGDDSRPSFKDVHYQNSVALPQVETDKMVLNCHRIIQLPSGDFALLMANYRRRNPGASGPGLYFGQQDLNILRATSAFPRSKIAKVFFFSNTAGSLVGVSGAATPVLIPEPGTVITPSAAGLTPGQWHYVWVKDCYVSSRPIWTGIGGTQYTLEEMVLVLGPKVETSYIYNQILTAPTAPTYGSTGPAIAVTGAVEPVWGENSDGINAVHMIDQLLFAKKPYGAGKDRSRFDTKSIEIAAIEHEKENIRAYCVVQEGDGAFQTVASVLQDIGMMIAWDPSIGKSVFRMIRYQDSDTMVDIPADIVVKAPEMVCPRGPRQADTIAFTFKNRERNYREDPLMVMDDGQVTFYETQRAKRTPITVTADAASAARMIPRRQQEVLSNVSAFSFTMNHDSLMAVPGSRFKLSALEGPQYAFMVSSVKRDINSPKTEVACLLDTYNPPPDSNEQQQFLDSPLPLHTTRNAGPATGADSLQAVEVPRPMAKNAVQVLFPVARASSKTSEAFVWASTDGLSFSVIDSVPFIVHGVLSDSLEARPWFDDGPVEVSPGCLDFEAIEDLSAKEDSWRAGRQVMLIGDEIIFVKRHDDGFLHGLIRGRLGTPKQDHPEGTPFIILISHRSPSVESMMFSPGRTISYKIQASEGGRLSDLSQVGEVELTGKAFTPLPPSGLRQRSLRQDYDSSLSLQLVWCWHSDEFPRTGLGSQGLGQATGVSPARGHFVVTFLDDAMDPVAETTVFEPQIVLSPSDRVELGLDSLPSWTVRVLHVEGSFSSSSTSLTLFPS